MILTDKKLIEALEACSIQERVAIAAMLADRRAANEVAKRAIRRIRRRLKREVRKEKR
jgi:hypothetical protein